MHRKPVRGARLGLGIRNGRGFSAGVQRDKGNPSFSNHNSGPVAMHLIISLLCV
jgi:hypothetical protein